MFARWAAARKCSPNVIVSSSYTRNPRSARAALISRTARRLGGAFFHVRTGYPSISTVSISNICPGAVSCAVASAIDVTMACDRTCVDQHRRPGPIYARTERLRDAALALGVLGGVEVLLVGLLGLGIGRSVA